MSPSGYLGKEWVGQDRDMYLISSQWLAPVPTNQHFPPQTLYSSPMECGKRKGKGDHWGTIYLWVCCAGERGLVVPWKADPEAGKWWLMSQTLEAQACLYPTPCPSTHIFQPHGSVSCLSGSTMTSVQNEVLIWHMVFIWNMSLSAWYLIHTE